MAIDKLIRKFFKKIQPPGFFTHYDYMSSLAPSVPEYTEFSALLERQLGPMQGFADTIRAQDDFFAKTLAPGASVSWETNWLGPLDCAAIYSAIPHFRPAKIVEIGSGNSTHFMMQAVKDHGLATQITCIDPAPRKSISALDVQFQERILSPQDASVTDQLGANDILFVDSSHLLQEGYDVDIIFNRLIPRLNRGVAVHVHDIFLPDPYPKHWKERHYNEQTVLGGWLFSGAFEVVFACSFVSTHHPELLTEISKSIPHISSSGGGSLWLRKTTEPIRP